MARPSVIPAVLERLKQFLDERESRFLAKPEGERSPTLPATSDGKVNVRAVAQAIELKQTQEKYLYEREELRSLIDLAAQGQGLLPIGARTLQGAGDRAFEERSAQPTPTGFVTSTLSEKASLAVGTVPDPSDVSAAERKSQRLERRVNGLEQQNAALVAENFELRRQLKDLRLQMGRQDMMIDTGRRIVGPSVDK